jgi:hypothetical protein
MKVTLTKDFDLDFFMSFLGGTEIPTEGGSTLSCHKQKMIINKSPKLS